MGEGPNRQGFLQATAELLGSGYALLGPELQALMSKYGYTGTNDVNNLLVSRSAQQVFTQAEVCVDRVRYRGRYIYFDSNLDPIETDFEEVKGKVDEIDNEVSLRRVASRQELYSKKLGQLAFDFGANET